MDVNDLLNRHCVEYPKGSPTLTPEEVSERLALVPGWELVDGKTLRLSQRLQDFETAVTFINQLAIIAEQEQHHPDIRLHSYRSLEVEFSTHSVGGLTDNDFIMAAKVNKMREEGAPTNP